MKISNRVLGFVMSAIMLLCTSCSTNVSAVVPSDYTIDREAPFFTNLSEKSSWELTVVGLETDGYNAPEDVVLPFKTAEAFTYEIDEGYDNRTDILHEIITLKACYSSFCENSTSDVKIKEAEEVYHVCMDSIVQKLKAFPPAEEHIKALQEEFFYNKIEDNKRQYNEFLESEKDHDQTELAYLQHTLLIEMSLEYDRAAVRDYESGKLTAEEACYVSSLGVWTGNFALPRYPSDLI